MVKASGKTSSNVQDQTLNQLRQLEPLLLANTPFLDVRAEIEFAKGSIPNAYNAPILTTAERHEVGTVYKQQGQAQAIELGHKLVSGAEKQRRVELWCELASQHQAQGRDVHLFCWRGGMRSNLAQQWMAEVGVQVPLIAGGYKALRNTVLQQFDGIDDRSVVVIGGKTGTAKTPLINAVATGVDLEGFAHHRGSSFGRRVQEPPCQVNFENTLGVDILRKSLQRGGRPLVFEDESRMIGPLSIPLPLWRRMECAAIAVVEMPLEFRVQRILEEYVQDQLSDHLAVDPDNGEENYRQHLLDSLHRVRKRLGRENYDKYRSILNDAINYQLSNGDVSYHRQWIAGLLNEYYDPMYEYQLAKKRERVVFQGDFNQVKEWVEQVSLRVD